MVRSPVDSRIGDEPKEWIMDIRNSHNLGTRRIQSELFRLHEYHLSLAVIHKVMVQQDAKPIKKLKRKKKFKRYSRPIPSDRVQIDQSKARNTRIILRHKMLPQRFHQTILQIITGIL